MDDDESKLEKRYPLSASKMSKTPSWITLGFLLGAAFILALPPLGRKPPPEPVAFRVAEPPKPEGPREPPQLTTIEAVFEVWGRHAVWADEVTEVALWSSRDNAYSQPYEVRRLGDAYYFRTIPRLTRRIVTHGKPREESPLQFTETEEQYAEWQKYGRIERAVERPARASLPASAPAPVPPSVDRSFNIPRPALPAPTSERSLPAFTVPAPAEAPKK